MIITDVSETKKALARYSDILFGIDMYQREKEGLKDAVLSAEQKHEIADIEAEFNPKIEALQSELSELEAAMKAYVLELADSVSGDYHQLVYSKGRVTWDTKVLTKIAQFIPEVKLAKDDGKPSVSIRAKK